MQITTLIRRAARSLATGALLGTCALALALPAPKDIEAAVKTGQFAQAETLLREVLQEKPNSARAHYELGQVLAHEAKYAEALAELQRAQSIDSGLKFAASPEKFQQTLDKISAAAFAAKATPGTLTTPATSTVAPATAPAPASPALNLNYVLLGIGALVLVAFLIRRSQAQAAPYPQPMTNAAGPVGFGAQYAPSGPGYAPANTPAYAPARAPGYGPGYGAPAQSGSGIGGAVLGGVAGLAAGYALTKAFEGDHHNASSSAATAGPAAGNSGYVPFETPAQPDLGSFDAGAGDGWDASEGSGSDDNW